MNVGVQLNFKKIITVACIDAKYMCWFTIEQFIMKLCISCTFLSEINIEEDKRWPDLWVKWVYQSIDNFWVAFCLCIKMSLWVKPIIWKFFSPTGSFSGNSNLLSCESFWSFVVMGARELGKGHLISDQSRCYSMLLPQINNYKEDKRDTHQLNCIPVSLSCLKCVKCYGIGWVFEIFQKIAAKFPTPGAKMWGRV